MKREGCVDNTLRHTRLANRNSPELYSSVVWCSFVFGRSYFVFLTDRNARQGLEDQLGSHYANYYSGYLVEVPNIRTQKVTRKIQVTSFKVGSGRV